MLHQRPAALRRTLLLCSGLSLAAIAVFTSIQGCKPEPTEPVRPSAATAPAASAATPTVTLSKAFKEADVMPEFRGDLPAWLAEHITYPESARKSGKQGRVVVKFIVSETGAIEEPEIVRGVDAALDAEALRAVKAMPAWTPGRDKGEAVPVYFNLPVSFKLK